jgi:hypothetical protein
MVATFTAAAAPVFADNFTYPNGPLLGQGSWIITGTSTVNPLQVVNGRASLMNTGQDANAAFSSPFTLGDSDSLYLGATINVSTALTGDYFLHVGPGPAGNSFDFFQRIFVKSSGTGFVLGYAETSGGATQTYGTDVLSFGTDYRVVLAYHRVGGNLNDTAALYVNPSLTEVDNLAYVTKVWNSTTAETNIVATVNLRQGTASSAATLLVDDLNVSPLFSEVAVFTPVPEPSCALLGGFGLFTFAFLRRRS